MSASRFLTICGLLFVLSACSGIGDGNKPNRVVILQVPIDRTLTIDDVLNPPADLRDFTTFTCVGGQLRAFVVFDDNSVGDFTTRSRWSSSKTGDQRDLVRVSNGEIEVQTGDLFFTPGGLVPPATLTAASAQSSVTAEYLGLRDTVTVTVRAPDADAPTIFEPAFARLDFDTTRPAFWRVAPGTSFNFFLRRKLGNEWADVSSTAELSILGDDDDTVADSADATDTDRYGRIGEGALFSAIDADADFDRRLNVVADIADDVDDDASLTDLDDDDSRGLAPDLTVVATPFQPGCPAIQTVLKVRKLASLNIAYQDSFRTYYPDPLRGHLAEGTSQTVAATGCFADDDGGTLPCTAANAQQAIPFPPQFARVPLVAAFDRNADGVCDVADLGAAGDDIPEVQDTDPVLLSLPLTANGTPIVLTARADDPDDGAGEDTLICGRFGANLSPSEDLGYPVRPGIISSSLALTVIDDPLDSMVVEAIDPCTMDQQIALLCKPLAPALNPADLRLEVGEVLQFRAIGSFTDDRGTPADTTDDIVRRQPLSGLVQWTSSDAAIASVGLGTGGLLARAVGTATITARVVRGSLDTTPPTAGDAVDEVETTTVTVEAAVED